MSADSQPAPPAPAATQDQPEAAPPRPRILMIAVLAAGVWILGLIVLALLSANPVTLNRMQIQRSKYVVTAKRVSADSNELEVSREWKQGEELGTITVQNLEKTGMPVGEEFLIPLLEQPSGGYLVTESMLPNNAPLIYPATDKAIEQLTSILEELGK